MAARHVIRPVFAIACLGLTALGLNNTYGDDSEVKALSEKTACGSAHCSVKMLSQARSAFKQSYGYQTALVESGKSGKSASVDVECQRAYVLAGEYSCKIVSGGLPQ